MKIKVLVDLKDSDDNLTLIDAGEEVEVDYINEEGDFVTVDNIVVGYEEAEIL